jgi:hypothetical protein
MQIGKRMIFYAVRLFKNNQWHIIRTYALRSEALEFAELLDSEWDIKEMSLNQINAQVAS